jgi:hypothetical protein
MVASGTLWVLRRRRGKGISECRHLPLLQIPSLLERVLNEMFSFGEISLFWKLWSFAK